MPNTDSGGSVRRVALIAFGCSPDGGSEQRSGWQWATSLADAGVHVTVFTHADQRADVEQRAPAGIRFEWVEASAPRVADLRPAYRSSLAYLAFLKSSRARLVAAHEAEPFDAGLHVSWSQIRSGTPLSAVEDLPYVFGPVGGGQRMPFELLFRELGSGAAAELFRALQLATVRGSRNARRSCRRAALVVAANAETAALASALGAGRVTVRPDGGLTELPDEPTPLPSFDEGLRVLWVGRLMPRKGLRIALDAVALAREHHDVRLTVVGDGSQRSLLDGDIDGVDWRGQVSPAALPELFSNHHVHLFTSLRESGAPPVIEAMGFGRPTVCLDQHGPAAIVDAANGVLVDPKGGELGQRFAAVLVDLAENPGRVAALAEGTRARRHQLLQTSRTEWMMDRLDEIAGSGPR